MSHLPERTDKDCLNCGAVVYAKYCHICGQENKVHKESAWHLLTHFFNDITHFDGKFFSSLKYLLFRPGFLSKEYYHGRRADYLNPVRMYVFTSAIFFLVFFTLYDIDKSEFSVTQTTPWETKMRQILPAMDSAEFKQMVKKLILTDAAFSINAYSINFRHQPDRDKKAIHFSLDVEEDKSFSALEKVDHRWLYQKIFQWHLEKEKLSPMHDSTFRRFIANLAALDTNITKAKLARYLDKRAKGITFAGDYKTREEYDSLIKTGVEKDGWWQRQFVYRQLQLNEKYHHNINEILASLLQKFTHSLPQMLFVSLPILALILKLLYIRRKNFYYVEHAIFTVHLFIFVFLMMLMIFGLNKLSGYWHWEGLGFMRFILVLWIFFYLYKAMRNFYQQRRAKTIFKYSLFLLTSYFFFIIIFMVFLFFSFIQI